MRIPANEALDDLRRGNARFVSGTPAHSSMAEERAAVQSGQEPKAVILGCSDSRVPPEIVFDQGLGDLFVVRVAGSVAAPPQIGSVEFAVEQLGTRLVVVLGHSQCGAVRAAVHAVANPGTRYSRNLRSIVDRITPAIAHLAFGDPSRVEEAEVARALRASILFSVNQLRHASPLLERFARESGLQTIAAEYSLETGRVTFLGGAP